LAGGIYSYVAAEASVAHRIVKGHGLIANARECEIRVCGVIVAKPVVTAARQSNDAAARGARTLVVKLRLPVCRHRAVRSRHRLIHRMRMRSGKLGAGEGFFCTVVVKPMLARLEALDDRVPRGGEMFRGMLTWRAVAAADVTALRTPAKMKPPFARSGAFDAACSARLGRRVDTIPHRLHRFLLAVSDARIALPNFYNVAVGIANVTARLAVFGLWLGDELGSPTFP
jgi:hypothetical protein